MLARREAEYERLARVLEERCPEEAERMRRLVALNPTNEAKVIRLLRERIKLQGKDPNNLPAYPMPANLPQGQLQCGHLYDGTQEGKPFSFSPEHFIGNLGIYGRTGIGKSLLAIMLATEAIALEIPTWVLNFSGEYLPLIRRFGPGVLLVVEASCAPLFNLLEPPPGIKPTAWIGHIKVLFRDTCWLRDGSLNLLGEAVLKLYERAGVLGEHNSGTYPTIIDLRRYLAELKFGARTRHAGFLESLLNRLDNLITFLGETLTARHSVNPHVLLNRSIVFQLAGLTETILDFFVNFLLMWVSVARQTGTNLPRLWNFFLIEEAHYTFSLRKLLRADLGEPFALSSLRTVRHAAVMLGLIDQVPGDLPNVVLANQATVICFQLTSGRCQNTIAQRMSLNGDQVEELARLPQGVAVVHYPGCGDPFLIKLPEMEHAPVPSNLEVEERISQSMQVLGAEPAQHVRLVIQREDEESREELVGNPRRVMIDICQQAGQIEERCERLGLSRGEEHAARRILERLGMIRLEGLVGNRRAIHAPTQKGASWAHRSRVRLLSTHGSRCHYYIVHKTVRELGKALPILKLHFGGTFNGTNTDAYGLYPSGDALVIQASYSRHHEHEAKALVRLCRSEMVNQVLMIANNKTILDGLTKAVRNEYGGDLPAKAMFLNFEDTLRSGYDWTWIAEHD